jgi:hypothetical protein
MKKQNLTSIKINTKRRLISILRSAAAMLLILAVCPALEAGTGKATLKVSGEYSANVTDAQASVSYMKRINIWKLTVDTPYKTYKSTGKSATAHIFFSRNFTLAAKTYPIAFSYLNKKDTNGGSFFYRIKGQRIPGFSFDTAGELRITKTGDTIEGTFSYTVFTSDSKPPQKKVKVTGTFSVPNQAGFPKGPPPVK